MPEHDLLRAVAAMFAEKRPALRPLPLEPFSPFLVGAPHHLVDCIEVDAGYAIEPWRRRQVRGTCTSYAKM
jgi:hypothetical protein